MGWRFWQKNTGAKETQTAKGPKLSRAKELPNEVGRHLVVTKGYEPDWVWSLRSVTRSTENSSTRLEIRIFSAETASQKGVWVKNFSSLDAHPELILFSGWYDKSNRRVQLEPPLDKTG